MPKGLALVREDETRAYFAYPSFASGAIAVVGWACAVLVLFYFDGVQRWVYCAMMALLGGVGTWGGLWREDLDLDVVHRHYRHRRGFWPAVQTQQGSFDQIAGIFLATETRLSSGQGFNRVYTVWVVRLALPGEKEGLTILSFDDESEALRRLKALSSNLHLPVIDSPTSRERPPFLGRPLIETLAGGAKGEGGNSAVFSWQPPAGRIVVSGQAPDRIIDLPPQTGIAATYFMGIAFTLCFCAAIYIVMVRLPGLQVRQDTPGETRLDIVLWSLGAGGLIVFGFVLASIRERIEEDGSDLRFATSVLGRSGQFTILKKKEIVSVTLEPAVRVSGRGRGIFPNASSLIRRVPIRPGSGKQEQVVVLSRVAAARLGVQLTPVERAWLRSALLSMIVESGSAMKDGF